MARKKRSEVFDPRVRGTYHVYNRCVRGAWLLSKKDKERRARLLEILEELAEIYAISILACAFLSNHFHLLLVNLPELVDRWSDREVLLRAQRAYPHRFAAMGIHRKPTDEQMEVLLRNGKLIKEMRRRLSDISWMMRMLQQRFAAEMNREAKKTGHFWEGRFQLVKIVSEAQLLVTMIYIALNQVKAGQASSLDTSFWTSVCWQLQDDQRWRDGETDVDNMRAGFLSPLGTKAGPPPRIPGGDLSSRRASDAPALEMSLDEFVRLARCALELATGKRARPSPADAQILDRVELSQASLELAMGGIL